MDAADPGPGAETAPGRPDPQLDGLIAEYFPAGRIGVERYAELLATTGVQRGLVGPREVDRIWERHILNCAAMAPLLPEGASVADVGTGAGLPGLVLALCRPDLKVTLVEPLLRRVTWLAEVIEELGLDRVQLLRGRAEDAARHGLEFEVVTSRAVANLRTLAGWCLPLLRPGGVMLAIKGEAAAEELAGARADLESAGVVAAEVISCGAGTEPLARVIRLAVGQNETRVRGRRTPGPPASGRAAGNAVRSGGSPASGRTALPGARSGDTPSWVELGTGGAEPAAGREAASERTTPRRRAVGGGRPSPGGRRGRRPGRS